MADLIIIGGGIVGMLTAREMAIQGKQVMLLEQHRCGSGCSWAGGGILSPLYPWHEPVELRPLINLSQHLYEELVSNLFNKTGIDVELIKSGLMILDIEEKNNACSWGKRKKITVDILDQQKLQRYAPYINSKFNSAILIESIYQIRNPRLLDAIKLDLQELGVEIKEHQVVKRINIESKKVRGVITENGKFQTENVVISSGARSKKIFSELPIYPLRGQMLCLFDKKQSIKNIILKDDTYIIPRKDGHILVGSTLEDVGFKDKITRKAKRDLWNKACTMIPDIESFEFVSQWSGLRPAIRGDFPIIGTHPEIEGLYINTGHFRNGLLLATGSARILRDIMLGKKTDISIKPFQFNSGAKALQGNKK